MDNKKKINARCKSSSKENNEKHKPNHQSILLIFNKNKNNNVA